MTTVYIPYGNKKIPLEIPEKNLVLSADFPFPEGIQDIQGRVLEALENPVAGPAFSSYSGKGKKVVILTDNFARLTPADKLLPIILRKIKEAGGKAEILVASGALREMNEAELNRKFGEAVLASGVPVYQSVCRNRWEFEFIGETSLGTPVNVHRKFLEADFRIAVTMTQATLWGYGGGGSMILPGVCSYETIEWNHRLCTGRYSGLGYEPPQNILRQDIEEAMQMAGLHMSLLVVLNPGMQIINVEAGETIAAHRKSVKAYDRYYTFDLSQLPQGQLDIGISGSFPGDRFFAHSCWPIANLNFFVKEGGTIILATPAEGGLAHFAYAKDYMPPTRDKMQKLYEDFFYSKQPFWHGCLWRPILKVLAKKNAIVVTEKDRLPLFAEVQIPAVSSADEALIMAMDRHGKEATVGFFPYGKWILPKGLHS
ncbi:MAG: DUF2088 domain-containing protein [Deltaproteobacteria bacterium]|nr:DUF2088 domain-containing protein [Deltaproteobacteria bacterium]